MEMAQKKPKWRKVVLSGALGAIVGAGAMSGLFAFLDSEAMDIVGVSEIAAAGVGLIYALIGFCVGIGLINPNLGFRYLNMEDADELRQQRLGLAYSSVGIIAMGVALILLAVSGPDGAVPAPIALAIAVVLFVAIIPLARMQYRHMDELMRSLSTETGNLAYYLVLVVGGGWAALAHLEFAPAPAPLDWLTMFFGLALFASFVAIGRRGMLEPR